MPRLNAATISTLTFDCYGTLIDWEAGAIEALRPLLDKHHVALSDDEIIAAMEELEDELIRPPYLSYRSVLAGVVEGFGKRFGFPTSEGDNGVLAASIPSWAPFPDKVDALRTLGRRYRLAIISNIDDDLFAQTAKQLPIRFAHRRAGTELQAARRNLRAGYRPSRRCVPRDCAHRRGRRRGGAGTEARLRDGLDT